MNENEELNRLGNELAKDEEVALAIERFDAVRRLNGIQQDYPQYYVLLRSLLVHEPEELRCIGSRMTHDQMRLVAAVMHNMACLIEGYAVEKQERDRRA